jgi:hypothetical protein
VCAKVLRSGLAGRPDEEGYGTYDPDETIERELPVAPSGLRVQLLTVDGARVPLQQGEWAEVKTLAIGTVRTPVQERREWVVHTEGLSYFSRLTDLQGPQYYLLHYLCSTTQTTASWTRCASSPTQ